MVRWKTEAVRMLVEVGEAQGPGIGDEETEDAMALGQRTDGLANLVADPDGDELRETRAFRVQDPERAVLGIYQSPGSLDDPPQHRREIQVGADRHDGVEQLTQAARPGEATRRHIPESRSPQVEDQPG